MSKQRINYIDPESITDPAMREEFERCRTEGTPRPESQAIRAHVPGVFWAFTHAWRDCFHNGVADHSIKELCRVYVSHSVKCEFCGNQRSIQSANRFGVRLLAFFLAGARPNLARSASIAFARAASRFWSARRRRTSISACSALTRNSISASAFG